MGSMGMSRPQMTSASHRLFLRCRCDGSSETRGASWTKPRKRDFLVEVVEDDLNSKTHSDVALDEVPVDERTLVEVDEHDVVGKVVGKGSDVGPMEDGEREYLAVPGGHDPIEVATEARRAPRVRGEPHVPTGAALRQRELVASCSTPELAIFGRGDGYGLGIGHHSPRTSSIAPGTAESPTYKTVR